MRRDPLDHLAIAGELFALARQLVLASDEEELGAEEPDAERAVVARDADLVDQFDVGAHEHREPVGRHARRVAEGEQRPLVRLVLPTPLLELGPLGGGGRHDDLARTAVDGEDIAVLHPPDDALERDHGGQLERPGHDRGVGGRPARLRDERGGPTALERHDVGRRQVVGDDDGALRKVPEALALPPQEVPEDAVLDVHEVVPAGAEVGVVHLLEARLHGGEGAAHRPLGVDPLPLDQPLGRLAEHPVLEHEEVAVEDLHVLARRLADEARLQLAELPAALLDRVGQSGAFRRDLLGRDVVLDDVELAPVEDQRGADRRARRAADAVEPLRLAHGAGGPVTPTRRTGHG
jgi:hypothetical protein